MLGAYSAASASGPPIAVTATPVKPHRLIGRAPVTLCGRPAPSGGADDAPRGCPPDDTAPEGLLPVTRARNVVTGRGLRPAAARRLARRRRGRRGGRSGGARAGPGGTRRAAGRRR